MFDSENRLERIATTIILDSTCERRSPKKTSPLPTFLDMTKHELKPAVSGSARRVVEMESCSSHGSKDSSEDHMGLSLTQITAYERHDEIGKPENDGTDHETSHVWAIPEVELLLKLYKDRENDLKDPRRKKKTIWNEICAEMRDHGFLVSSGQCECKMKNMKATYRRTLDRARAADNNVPRCAFYEELYDIFGLSPHVRTFPNTPDANYRKRSHVQAEQQDNEEVLADEQRKQSKQSLGHGPKMSKSEVGGLVDISCPENDIPRSSNAEFIEELKMLRKALEQERQARDEERRKNEEERDRRAREFHEERLAMLNSMNRLISNLGSKE